VGKHQNWMDKECGAVVFQTVATQPQMSETEEKKDSDRTTDNLATPSREASYSTSWHGGTKRASDRALILAPNTNPDLQTIRSEKRRANPASTSTS